MKHDEAAKGRNTPPKPRRLIPVSDAVEEHITHAWHTARRLARSILTSSLLYCGHAPTFVRNYTLLINRSVPGQDGDGDERFWPKLYFRPRRSTSLMRPTVTARVAWSLVCLTVCHDVSHANHRYKNVFYVFFIFVTFLLRFLTFFLIFRTFFK